jgi:hypothetical protein
MVHLLAVQSRVNIAMAGEQLGREHFVDRLGLLQAQDVRLFLGDQALNQLGPGANRVDGPRGDLDGRALARPLARLVLPRKEMAPAPGAWSEGRLAFVTQGIPRTRVTGGNPKHIQDRG